MSGERGLIDYAIEPAIVCVCGSKIYYYTLAYGRTPYIIQCQQEYCKLSLYDVMPSGVGWHLNHEHAIEAFRDYVLAVEWHRERGIRNPSPAQLREYFYREMKGWGHNPGPRDG